MVFKSIIGTTCACLVVVSFSADAALVSRLGGQAYYDTVADLTWLADANYAKTSGYDDDGRMLWTQAKAWADGLSVGGIDTWRLPSSDTCTGFNCASSEMGNLYYNVLGNTAGNLTNLGPFTGVDFYYYWSQTPESIFNNNKAWSFFVSMGNQGLNNLAYEGGAWAVHSGDVSAVPIPAAVWLFGSGLLGLIGLARRKA